MANHSQNHPFDHRIGRYELFFKKRYKVLYTINDFLIGLIFLIGSFFFFKDTLIDAGTWLFVVGSALLLIRPTIRLVHDIHLKKVTDNEQ
ncbi:YrhK family protein [Aureibacillus halotolerans]|uniref:YrhK-like protein n=1 Tax=Aureibacillus halotolerans TaxID=1508390 RepID=A0A4R6TTX4_9BACI|nr:YrhK family protein [Aureibacillus halotolerans]TDQ37140.1 YrhK-like protein [Aureibacillus halotolerans]